jgi:hypothetical protein
MPRREQEPYDSSVGQTVLNLRRAGVPFDVIAEQVNLTPESARAYFDKAIGAGDLTYQRALEADRMDRLHTAVWPAAIKGDPKAVDSALRISERRERLRATPKENDHAFRDAFDKAASTSEALNPDLDAALVEAGRKIANQVDEAAATAEGVELTKALYLVPHMMNVLREMLATPASRNAADALARAAAPKAEENEAPTTVARLRAIHVTKKSDTG